MEVGMLWKYEVHDSLTGITDTVVVSIVDTATIADGSLGHIWKYNRNDAISTGYTSTRGDTLAIYRDSANIPAFEYFIFPLTVGKVWIGPFSAWKDSNHVIEEGLISVPAGDFVDGIRVDRFWGIDFEGGGDYSSTWIVPDVGFVYRYQLSKISDGASITVTVNEIWKLLSYDLSTFTIDQFPTGVGSEWVYETYDSSSTIYDTVEVGIVEIANLSGGRVAYLWEFNYPALVDTQYVIIDGNKIEIFPDTFLTYFDAICYEFPLTVGRYWGISTFVPIPDVIEKGTITVPAGTFESGFRHIDAGGAFNYYWYEDSWLVPEIGFVFRARHEYGFDPGRTIIWKLLSYQIPQEIH
jgi:hypothetical protein